ncbi:hypothetical protein BD779DRAFT_1694702, partial [Infundibulicybe gibba]
LENIASVSRSSGLDKDGDALKDQKVQEEYWEFIQEKLNEVQTRYAWHSNESEAAAKQRVDVQENILIRLRKLREGVSSSKRNDIFALEVYETSLYLSTLFESQRQAISVIHQLVPELYLSIVPTTSASLQRNHCIPPILVALVHHLVAVYPSQSQFDQLLSSIPISLFPKNLRAYKWIKSVSASLRCRNYVKFEELTRKYAVDSLFEDGDGGNQLSRKALYFIVDSLRKKARDTAWKVICSSYREITNATDTRDWLKRSLCLDSIIANRNGLEIEQWLQERSKVGDIRQKENIEGRWIVCKNR